MAWQGKNERERPWKAATIAYAPYIGGVLIFGVIYFVFAIEPQRCGRSDSPRAIARIDVSHPCGVACMSLVSRVLGRPMSVKEASRIAPPDALGRLSLAEIRKALCTAGMYAVAVRMSADKVSELHVPAILHWDNMHFVVAVVNEKGHVLILDPPDEPREVDMTRLHGSFSGSAILVHSDEKAVVAQLHTLGLD